MSFCDHCDGQRFDRSRMLRLLRRHLRECPAGTDAREALSRALAEIRSLDIPHLELLDDIVDGEVVH
jgi:phage terminase Nu1 subunit (DNA packaging protein)